MYCLLIILVLLLNQVHNLKIISILFSSLTGILTVTCMRELLKMDRDTGMESIARDNMPRWPPVFTSESGHRTKNTAMESWMMS